MGFNWIVPTENELRIVGAFCYHFLNVFSRTDYGSLISSVVVCRMDQSSLLHLSSLKLKETMCGK